MPLAWEASLRLVDEVNQLRFSCPQHELLALLDDLPSPSSPSSPSSSRPANGRTANAANAAYLPPPAAERRFLYGADGAPSLGAPVVPCKNWRERPLEEILESALSELKRCGFVVLEELVCPEKLQALLADFRRQRTAGLPEGVTFSRMRAQRDMTVPPFNKLWAQDDVICHPLILALLARYVRNSTNMSEEKSAEMSFAQWLGAGGGVEHFTSGEMSAGYPELDLMVVVDTPAGAPAQTRHRDTILPGPCASLGVHIPLTKMQAEPLNGAIGFFPGSHVLRGELGDKPKLPEMVGATAPGSVILYDSFTEHRGLENVSAEARAALFAWFRVPGVYTGHTEENFGPEGLERADAFRRYLRPRLREAEERQRAQCPGACESRALEAWGFRRPPRQLVPWTRSWGEERVCFRCNRTRGEGNFCAETPASRRREWYCRSCWEECRSAGVTPAPWPGNMEEPWQEDRVSEERLEELQAQGLNITPGKGRHKLTLLRERGYFLPVDPLPSWLDRVSNDPQPSGWKDGMRKALGEVPRSDGF
ncbi:unnamed protein product [Effrenium voratum]|uniref:Phytanoyl-CoA dioxygenase n=1 Tax=Effrenium voratum TaxID=2562239 RepID=A0AA36IW90_9DINO|nr:unnamed protein product [Effrenium voratum]